MQNMARYISKLCGLFSPSTWKSRRDLRAYEQGQIQISQSDLISSSEAQIASGKAFTQAFVKESKGLKPRVDSISTVNEYDTASIEKISHKDISASNQIMGADSTFDCIIIGGGPAGLSAATTLSLQLHSVVLFDAGFPRNRDGVYQHMVAGWEGRPPAELKESMRADLDRYEMTQVCDVAVVAAKKLADDQFEVTDAAGKTWTGRRLLLATGVREVWPEIEGYQEGWGKWIYPCLYSSGWEHRGSDSCGVLAVGMLAAPGMVLQMAHIAHRLCKTVKIYTNGDDALGDEIVAWLKGAPGYVVDSRKILKVQKPGEKVRVDLEAEAGTTTSDMHQFLAHLTTTYAPGPFKDQLGLETTPFGDYRTRTCFMETSVKGVFTAGDCSSTFKVAPVAASNGNLAASGVVVSLHEQDLGIPALMQ